jgi:hypothetical protein
VDVLLKGIALIRLSALHFGWTKYLQHGYGKKPDKEHHIMWGSQARVDKARQVVRMGQRYARKAAGRKLSKDWLVGLKSSRLPGGEHVTT